MTDFPTWSSADPAPPPRRWILASGLWAATKENRDRILKTSLAWMSTTKRSTGAVRVTRENLRLAKVQQPLVVAAFFAAWVSLFPLAPQQAKREAVIAVDPVHVVDELVSRQRAAQSARSWGWTS